MVAAKVPGKKVRKRRGPKRRHTTKPRRD